RRTAGRGHLRRDRTPSRVGGARPGGPAHRHLRDPARLPGAAVRPGGTPAEGPHPPQRSRRTRARLPPRLRLRVGRRSALRLLRRPPALDPRGAGPHRGLAGDGRAGAVASGRSDGAVGGPGTAHVSAPPGRPGQRADESVTGSRGAHAGRPRSQFHSEPFSVQLCERPSNTAVTDPTEADPEGNLSFTTAKISHFNPPIHPV